MPSHQHPWLRHWARPLIARFEYLIGLEMQRLRRWEKEMYEKAKLTAPADIIPVVQPIVEVINT